VFFMINKVNTIGAMHSMAIALLVTAIVFGFAACPTDDNHTHDSGAWRTVLEPGCETEGTEELRCIGCNEFFDSRSISVLGHDYRYVEGSGTAPTCTVAGYGVEVCSHDPSHRKEEGDIAALGHDYQYEVTTPATCTGGGTETGTCSRDPSHTRTNNIAALGHIYGDWVETTAPTCEEDGEETRTCSRDASHTYTREAAALGHNYGNWRVTTAPTCEEDGEETGTCSHNANHTGTRPVDALGHDYQFVEGSGTAPTCTEDGTGGAVCSHDPNHTIETGVVPALGHNYQWQATTAPTCEEDGEETGTCSRDASHTLTQNVAALGHNYQWQVTTAASPTESKIETETCSHNHLHTQGMRLTDGRDDKIYKIVKIGDQTWFAENLDYNATGGQYYGNDQAANEKYGRLYPWATAMDSSLCPAGWHLPSEADWNVLMKYVQEDNGETYTNGERASVAGKYLKATSGWNNSWGDGNGNGEDKYGFTALPGGRYIVQRDFGSFQAVGGYGYWWTSSEDSIGMNMYNNGDSLTYTRSDPVMETDLKTCSLSVRFVRN
jgi:uncharacterized protein (TIGR02145 family)